MTRRSQVFRVPMSGPSDVSGVKALIEKGQVAPEDIVAILGKTEGNGCVNDFTRGYSTFAFQVMLSEVLGASRDTVAQQVAFVMSGGTEGVLSPHATVFARRETRGASPKRREKRLSIGVSHSRVFRPEEIGTAAMVNEVARATKAAMADADIDAAKDVHFVQIKCPLLTSERMEEARRRGGNVVTHDTYESMGYSRGASALGVAVALGEIKASAVTDAKICRDWSLYSEVASTSAGIELMNCEIIVMGNAPGAGSDMVIGHGVMRDAIDGGAVREALRAAGIDVGDAIGRAEADRIVNVFAKAEADPSGYVRGMRHTMMNDSDINNTRAARSVVGGVIASIVGNTMLYVSGGAEHQGPSGGGPVAVIARV
ncbi:MAG: ring-opening amidohydrolase [Stellaceae bacterium]